MALRPPERPERPARRQVDAPAHHDRGAGGEVYNIWYHKQSGDRDNNRQQVAATSKCNLELDSGYTRADDTMVPYFCLHFARGHCFAGQDCNFLHRKPTPWDQARLDMTHDIFGRERHREERSDMGGVGSMFRTNKTIYVNYGAASSYGQQGVTKLLRNTFSAYGNVQSIKVVLEKSIAFVTYDIRASAEFAKECLSNQSLKGSTANEILNVRWAYDDQNPLAVIKRKRDAERELAQAVQVKAQQIGWDGLGQDDGDDINRYSVDDPYYLLPIEGEEEEGERGVGGGVGLVAGREGGCAGEKEKKGAPKGDDGDDDDDDGGGGEDERSLPALGLLAGYDSSESE